MKTKVLIIFIVLSVIVITFLVANNTNENDSRNTGNGNVCWYQDDDGEMIPCVIDDFVDTYAIDDEYGNVTHYSIDQFDEIPCYDLMRTWHPEFREIEPYEIIVQRYDTCFEETFGGPGNRHPAFLGYKMPEICTDDMIKHLVKYSNMFFADEENFYLAYAGLPDSVNLDDYDVCLDELLELRKPIKTHSGDIPITEFVEPEQSPHDVIDLDSLETECKQPLSPHKDALWNEEYCWWFLYEPLVPFEQIEFDWSYSTNNDPLGEIEKWCKDNDGLWFPNNFDCRFIHKIDGEKAKADLESRENIKVSGKIAQRICEIIDFPCPENPEFDGSYNLSSGKTHVNLYNQGTQFTFRLINDTISYKICIEDMCKDHIDEKIHN